MSLAQKENEWKAAFQTPRRLFEAIVMLFGQTGAPAAFMQWMTHIFTDLMAKKWIVFYMDNFLVLGKDAKELEQQTIALMEKARKHNIFFKLSKCHWHRKEINMLDFKVENRKLQMKKKKVVNVKN